MVRSFMGPFVCLFLAAFSFSSYALECHLNSERGSTEEPEEFGNIKFPVDVPLRTRLWTSKQITRTMVCWSELGVLSEAIYIYPNPDNIAPPLGISFGLIYNGIDKGKFGKRIETKISTNRRTSQRNKNPITFNISYQIYMERSGPIGNITRLNLDIPD